MARAPNIDLNEADVKDHEELAAADQFRKLQNSGQPGLGDTQKMNHEQSALPSSCFLKLRRRQADMLES